MFKKKPQIKNLSPLRSSDRRKLADQIISDYAISIPPPVQLPPASSEAPESTSTPPTITTLRASLLPENTSSARFTTTSGPNATAVSGSVYVGTYPGQDERILWFSYGKDPKLIPTVYALWQNPNIIPLLHTADFVVEDKLKAGADLMTPGLVKANGTRWDTRANKGAIVAVANIKRDRVPQWVGVAEIDIAGLSDDLRGAKGVAVHGMQWEGDEAWSWSSVGKGGRPAPDDVNGWTGLTQDLEQAMNTVDLENADEEDRADGGVSLERSVTDLHQSTVAGDGDGDGDDSGGGHGINGTKEDEELEPTTKEVDDAFHQAFLYSLYNAKKNAPGPTHGIEFPILPSTLIASLIQPYLRVQGKHYNIKKTSWKNTKKFIKYLDKQALVKSKDRSGGETVILDADFNDQAVLNFQPYKLPKPKPKEDTNSSEAPSGASSNADSSLGQSLSIQTVYRVSSKLVPHLLESKTNFYTSSQISSALKTYIEANPNLTAGVSISRNIKLDPFIANSILASNPTPADEAALRKGEVDRGALNKRLLDDDHLCIPYHLILRNHQTYDPTNPDPSLKPRAGPAPRLNITIEKRTGMKLVTKIANLEPFFINPQLLAPELQKKCAGAASVGQLIGGKPGMLEIVIQGDQRDILVQDVLAKRGIKVLWVDVVDKAKAKKKR